MGEAADRVRPGTMGGGLAVFLGGCSFGVLSTIVKRAYGAGYHLGEVTGTQALFGALLLWAGVAIERWHRGRRGRLPSSTAFPSLPGHAPLEGGEGTTSAGTGISVRRRTPNVLLVLAGFATGAVSILYYQSVRLVPASIAIVLLMQYLWIGLLLEWLLFRVRPTAAQWSSMGLVLLGTLAAAGIVGGGGGSIDLAGIGFGLGAAFAYALFLLISGRVGLDRTPLEKSALLITGATLLILTLLRPTFLVDGRLLGVLFPIGLALALFGTVLPPLLFAYGIPRVGVSTATILSASELPVAVAFSRIVLREPVTLLQWGGVVTILGAILLVRRRREGGVSTDRVRRRRGARSPRRSGWRGSRW